MSIVRSRRGFFSAMCGGFLALVGRRPNANALGENVVVPGDPAKRRPIEFHPLTRTYVYDGENRLLSVIESAEPSEVTVYTYG